MCCVGRAWPIFVGSGFGLGFGMSNCQHDFKRLDSLHLTPIRVRGSMNEVCHLVFISVCHIKCWTMYPE